MFSYVPGSDEEAEPTESGSRDLHLEGICRRQPMHRQSQYRWTGRENKVFSSQVQAGTSHWLCACLARFQKYLVHVSRYVKSRREVDRRRYSFPSLRPLFGGVTARPLTLIGRHYPPDHSEF